MRSLADVVLTVQYAARDGGGPLRTAALSSALAPAAPPHAVRYFTVRKEFPQQWAAFETALDEDGGQVLTLSMDGMLQFVPGHGEVRVTKARLALTIDHDLKPGVGLAATLSPPEPAESLTLRDASVALATRIFSTPVPATGLTFTVTITKETIAALDEALVETYPEGAETKRLRPTVFRDVHLIVELERDPVAG